jgi:NitT/TauT family transport system ATP-binding protein
MSQATTAPILTIRDLQFAYGEPVPPGASGASAREFTISGLTLSLQKGEIVSIIGASGCGKSTLLNLIAGLLSPSAGTIALASDEEKGKRKIGYIFQDDALFPWRTVKENLLLSAQIGATEKKTAMETIQHYLQTFHLKEEILTQYPSQLSGGMRQRVSIIQSLMFDPELLLLDEPFSALDFYTKLRLETEVYEFIKQQRKAAILVTHDIEEAVAMSDRVLLMKKGGTLMAEHMVDLGAGTTPDTARGNEAFPHLFQQIWSELKTVVEQ